MQFTTVQNKLILTQNLYSVKLLIFIKKYIYSVGCINPWEFACSVIILLTW